MNKELKKIVNDNKSGSLQILSNLIKYCKRIYLSNDELKSVCEIAELNLFHFAAIKNFILLLDKKIKNSNPEQIFKFLIDYESEQNYVAHSIYLKNKKILSKINSFTTISFSKTILDLIKIIYEEKKLSSEEKLKVFVLESRPMLEGRKFISELSKLNLDATLVVDSLMCYAVKESDAVLIGADQIYNNGNVVNKIGSYSLALCAKEFNKPFYIIADKSKYVTKDSDRKEIKYASNNYPSSQVWKTKRIVNILNQYFEEVPAKHITKILSY